MPPTISRERTNPIIFTDEYPWYQARTSPCEASCPAGNAIQKAIFLIQGNRFEEALETIRATNPFPGITGRVCFYPCETACNRGSYDQRVAFRSLERAIADHSRKVKVKKPRKLPDTGKHVAVVGGGPAGMTGAYFLALLGHRVTVFEASSVLGGIPRIIPQRRLPGDVVDRELAEIAGLGVRVRTNTRVGKDIGLEEIMGQYDACLVATGAWQSKTLPIPGAEFALFGLPFLTQVAAGAPPALGNRVVVVGSGGTAFDCASSALCLGVKEVHIACLEAEGQMLATPDEIERGMEEGILIHNSQSFTRILSEDGRVTGLECQDIRSFGFDANGKLQLDAVPGSEHVIPADTVIFAVGQAPDLACVGSCAGVNVTKHPTLEVDPVTLRTSREGLFAAGDAATGSKSIVEAIGGGRNAAISIHRYLMMRNSREQIRSISLGPDGALLIETSQYKPDQTMPQRIVTYEHLANVEFFDKKPRVAMRAVSFPESIQPGCGELHKGYTKSEAIEEAERCFHCGHCFQCRTCVEVCPEDVFVMGEDGAVVAYPDECYTCGSCIMDCPCSAITMRIPAPMRLAAVRVHQP